MSASTMPETSSNSSGADLAASPPQDYESEQAVLGSAMLSADALATLAETLSAGDLFTQRHQAIYRACLDLFTEGAPVDPITVSAELARRGELDRVGGGPYLHTLTSVVPTATNANYYAELVATQASLRRLGEAGRTIVQTAEFGTRDGAPTPQELLSRAQHALDQVDNTRSRSDVSELSEMAQPALEYLDGMQTGADEANIIPTGLDDLDTVIGGLRPGQMITIAARPGIGKSALGVQFARHAAIRHDRTSVVFSLEMGKNEIMTRVLSAETRVRLQDMRRKGGLSDDDWTRIAATLGEINEAPLLVDDSPNLTITDIRSKARKLQQQRGLHLVVVDYLQLMTSGARVENRQQEVAEFSRQLKLLAKELDVPVVALSQLNRGSEARADKRPMLADLRESGAIEQDSDVVLLMDRPDARATDEDEARPGEADLILAKHRDGPMATVGVVHQLHYSRFSNKTSE